MRSTLAIHYVIHVWCGLIGIIVHISLITHSHHTLTRLCTGCTVVHFDLGLGCGLETLVSANRRNPGSAEPSLDSHPRSSSPLANPCAKTQSKPIIASRHPCHSRHCRVGGWKIFFSLISHSLIRSLRLTRCAGCGLTLQLRQL